MTNYDVSECALCFSQEKRYGYIVDDKTKTLKIMERIQVEGKQNYYGVILEDVCKRVEELKLELEDEEDEPIFWAIDINE